MRKVISKVLRFDAEGKIKSHKKFIDKNKSNMSPQVELDLEYYRNIINEDHCDENNELEFYISRFLIPDYNCKVGYFKITLDGLVLLNRFFIYPIISKKEPLDSIRYYIDSADISYDKNNNEFIFKAKSKPKYIILPEKMNYNSLVNKEDKILAVDFSGKTLPIYSVITFPTFKEILSTIDDMIYYIEDSNEIEEVDQSTLWRMKSLGFEEFTKCKYKDESKKVVDIDLNITL